LLQMLGSFSFVRHPAKKLLAFEHTLKKAARYPKGESDGRKSKFYRNTGSSFRSRTRSGNRRDPDADLSNNDLQANGRRQRQRLYVQPRGKSDRDGARKTARIA